MLVQMLYDELSNVWSGLIVGELDAVEAPKLIEEAKALLEKKPAGMVLDCVDLDFVDSMGLGALVKLRKLVEACGGTVSLINMKKRIYKLFVITKLDSSFTIEVEP